VAGANVFGSDGATLSDGTVLRPVTGHNSIGTNAAGDAGHYFGLNTESMGNIKLILNGKDTLP